MAGSVAGNFDSFCPPGTNDSIENIIALEGERSLPTPANNTWKTTHTENVLCHLRGFLGSLRARPCHKWSVSCLGANLSNTVSFAPVGATERRNYRCRLNTQFMATTPISTVRPVAIQRLSTTDTLTISTMATCTRFTRATSMSTGLRSTH